MISAVILKIRAFQHLSFFPVLLNFICIRCFTYILVKIRTENIPKQSSASSIQEITNVYNEYSIQSQVSNYKVLRRHCVSSSLVVRTNFTLDSQHPTFQVLRQIKSNSAFEAFSNMFVLGLYCMSKKQ